MTPTDPYYEIQYQFDLIGDIERIWDEFDGTGVHVGVYDDGVEYTHTDLAPNYDASLHFTHNSINYDPFPPRPGPTVTGHRWPGSSPWRPIMAKVGWAWPMGPA